MFKTTMKSNAKVALDPHHIIIWPLIKMWKINTNPTILFHDISKYMKLEKIAMIQVMSLVEEKWVCSNLNFIKSQIHNQLIEHLALHVHTFGQFFWQYKIFLTMKL
jgi:hypothetical protein